MNTVLAVKKETQNKDETLYLFAGDYNLYFIPLWELANSISSHRYPFPVRSVVSLRH